MFKVVALGSLHGQIRPEDQLAGMETINFININK